MEPAFLARVEAAIQLREGLEGPWWGEAAECLQLAGVTDWFILGGLSEAEWKAVTDRLPAMRVGHPEDVGQRWGPGHLNSLDLLYAEATRDRERARKEELDLFLFLWGLCVLFVFCFCVWSLLFFLFSFPFLLFLFLVFLFCSFAGQQARPDDCQLG